jgi:hypothetical protein
LVAFVFVEARALEPGTGEPLVRLSSVAYPADFVLGIFPFPSVTNYALDFVFEFGGAVLFFCSLGVGCKRSTHVVCDVVSVGRRFASSVRGRWNRRDNLRLHWWLTASFGHGIAMRSRVVGANWIANREGSAAAFHPSLYEAERERRARVTIVPLHVRRFRWRGCPSLV